MTGEVTPELVNRCRRCTQPLYELVTLTQNSVLTCLPVLGDKEDAQDAAQEAYVRFGRGFRHLERKQIQHMVIQSRYQYLPKPATSTPQAAAGCRERHRS